jgi:thiamine-phosphate diphosphorylase
MSEEPGIGRTTAPEGPDRKRLLRAGRGLYLILTRPRIDHVRLAAAACERKVPVIQLREKDMKDGDLLDLARRLADLVRGTETLLIVNDRPDMARASGADGVHLGREDADYEEARALLGPDAIIGLSTRTADEAEAALAAGADYIGVGPVFPTATKPDAQEPIGLGGLKNVAGCVPGLPKVAIGGIGASNVARVMAAGAGYAAVVSAVCHEEDPVSAMDDLLSAIRDAVDDRIDGQANYEGLRFCPRCSCEFDSQEIRGRDRLVCPSCHYIFYTTPATVTCVIAEREGKLLLVLRKYQPGRGRWCLPAGFIEAGEHPRASAEREVLEETGLNVEVDRIYDCWATDEDPRTPVVSIAFTARVKGGELLPGDDASDARFFDFEHLPEEIAFADHRRVIARYVSERRSGFQRRAHGGAQTSESG